MTEAEWLAGNEPMSAHRMLEALRDRASDRKLRLFGCASCRGVWRLFEGSPIREAVEAAERYVDGGVTQHHWARVRRGLAWVEVRGFHAHLLASRRVSVEWAQQVVQSVSSALHFHLGLDGQYGRRTPDTQLVEAWKAAWAAHAGIVREIFGNPFRPASFSPAWRTDTAVSLASQMYEGREFSAMPILADALQDVGCDDEQILAHCRDTGVSHVRGCWVVDLVLGKE
jgi:hypothetical protein